MMKISRTDSTLAMEVLEKCFCFDKPHLFSKRNGEIVDTSSLLVFELKNKLEERKYFDPDMFVDMIKTKDKNGVAYFFRKTRHIQIKKEALTKESKDYLEQNNVIVETVGNAELRIIY